MLLFDTKATHTPIKPTCEHFFEVIIFKPCQVKLHVLLIGLIIIQYKY